MFATQELEICTDIIKKTLSKACVKWTQSWFAEQAWKSSETHGKTAPEVIYKEMQRRTKDKAEEENLVEKMHCKCFILDGEGQGLSANDTQVHNSKYCKRNNYVKASKKRGGEKVVLIWSDKNS